jgi:hypothetical protein
MCHSEYALVAALALCEPFSKLGMLRPYQALPEVHHHVKFHLLPVNYS